MSERPDMSDEEVDLICAGYTQNLAKVRHLRSLGLRVDRRPNGRPLVARAEWDRVFPRKQADITVISGEGPRWTTPMPA